MLTKPCSLNWELYVVWKGLNQTEIGPSQCNEIAKVIMIFPKDGKVLLYVFIAKDEGERLGKAKHAVSNDKTENSVYSKWSLLQDEVLYRLKGDMDFLNAGPNSEFIPDNL